MSLFDDMGDAICCLAGHQPLDIEEIWECQVCLYDYETETQANACCQEEKLLAEKRF